MPRVLRRPLWILLLPCLSGWVACQGSDVTGGAAAGMPSSGGFAGMALAVPQLSGQSGGGASAGATAAGAAGATAVVCADATAPNAWASWPLPDPATTGQADSQSFTLTAEVATDDVTQLHWQRHSPDQTFTWQEAKQYCDCLSLEDHDDWRLPSRMELVSIVDYTKQNPSLDDSAFPGTPFEWFWSASPAAGRDEHYWYVAFFDGDTHAASSDQPYRARCVRQQSGQLPRYDSSLAGTVTDTSTGLTWQREASAARVTWPEADLACAALTLQGGGFRLPSMKELQSLIDESTADPAIDTAAFPDTPSEGFWAATPLAGVETSAWFVSFLDGIAYNALHEHSYRFRCVR